MTSCNFRVKLNPRSLSHLTTNLGPSFPLPKLRHKLTTSHPFKKAVIIACRNKSDFSFVLTSAVNVTARIAAECRAVASAATPLVLYAWRSATNPPHVGAAVA